MGQVEFAEACAIGKNTLNRLENSMGKTSNSTWRLIHLTLEKEGVSWSADSRTVTVTVPKKE